MNIMQAVIAFGHALDLQNESQKILEVMRSNRFNGHAQMVKLLDTRVNPQAFRAGTSRSGHHGGGHA